MARQGIFTGFTPNDGLGDSLASGAVKINANFEEIYTQFGDGSELSSNAGSAGTWSKASTYGISTSKYVGIGTTMPQSQLHVEGNVLLAGITTGSFRGDGSGLTGVTATGSGIVVKDGGSVLGVAQTVNFNERLIVGTVFGGNVTIDAADYVSYATVAGISSYTPTAGYSSITDYSPVAGVATYATNAGVATYATTAGIVTYSAAAGVATNAGVAEYAKVSGISSYTPVAGLSTMAGYAHTAGIATVAQNLSGTPSILVDNINSGAGIVTFPGQGSKMRFDFDSTTDMPSAVSWRGMFAYANNAKQAYVSYGTTNGGYNGWRRLLVEDIHGNYQTTGILTASTFYGDASGLFNLPSSSSIWRSGPTGITTTSNVGIGTTNAEEALAVLGNFRLKGRIVGTATTNILPFLYAEYRSLPSPVDYHGAFVHTHDTGKAYYAHAGRWTELVNRNVDGTIGVGTDHFTAGIITATAFYGDGSNLTGVTAEGSGVAIQEEGSTVGTAATINFVGSGVTATYSNGIATIEITDVVGSGSTGGGATTLNDLTDVVSSGAQINDILKYNGSIWTTATGIGTQNADNIRLGFGAANDLQIWHDGNQSYINENGTGSLFIDSSALFLQNAGQTKLQVTGSGINVTGVVTATSFVGDGSGLTNLPSGGGGGGTPGGSDGQVQFNNQGEFAGDNNFYYDTSIDMLRAGQYVGIGMTVNTSYRLEVNGRARFWGSDVWLAGGSGSLVLDRGSAYANIYTTGTNRGLCLQAAGSDYVAIGGTNPTSMLTVEGDVLVSGALTATSFTGDGSGLTGVVGSGSGVIVQDDGSNVGTAGTINFGSNLSVSAISAGVVTVTASGGGGAAGVWTTTGVGIHTTKSVGIGTTNPITTLQVINQGFTGQISSSFTASAGGTQLFDTFSTDFVSAEYTLHILNGSNHQLQKMLIMHNAQSGVGSAFVSEYGIIYDPNRIADVTASVAAGVVQVNMVPLAGISGVTTYRFSRQTML
tara:strand:- start:4230 stop:7202 length:2973 start_codon:yes stop_codon:yes gene_type:complete